MYTYEFRSGVWAHSKVADLPDPPENVLVNEMNCRQWAMSKEVTINGKTMKVIVNHPMTFQVHTHGVAKMVDDSGSSICSGVTATVRGHIVNNYVSI